MISEKWGGNIEIIRLKQDQAPEMLKSRATYSAERATRIKFQRNQQPVWFSPYY